MGFIFFIGFCLILLRIIRKLLIDLKNQPPKRNVYDANQIYYDADDELVFDEARTLSPEPKLADSCDDGELYGGIPFGDGKIFMTDDDDFIEEFGDEVL